MHVVRLLEFLVCLVFISIVVRVCAVVCRHRDNPLFVQPSAEKSRDSVSGVLSQRCLLLLVVISVVLAIAAVAMAAVAIALLLTGTCHALIYGTGLLFQCYSVVLCAIIVCNTLQ